VWERGENGESMLSIAIGGTGQFCDLGVFARGFLAVGLVVAAREIIGPREIGGYGGTSLVDSSAR